MKLIVNVSSVRVTILLNIQRLTQEEMKTIDLESVDNMQELRRIAWYIEQVSEAKNKIS